MESLTDLIYINKFHGIAVGKNGTLISTNDGGESWISQSDVPNYNLWDIAKKQDMILVVGERGAILESMDQGMSWESLNLGVSENLYGIDFLDYFTGLIVGGSIEASSIIFRTEDSGINWSQISIDHLALTTNLRQVTFVPSSSRVIAIGARGTVIESNDEGLSWELRKDMGTTCDLWDISFLNSDTGALTGDKGTFLYTDDGGNSWRKVDVGTDENLRQVYFSRTKRVFLVTDQGSILWSKHRKGYSWPKWHRDNTYDLNAFYALSGSKRGGVQVVGWNGRVFNFAWRELRQLRRR